MALRDKGKTEHAGAKHTKGFWGHKAEAKSTSATQRRLNDKLAVDPWFNDYSLENDLLEKEEAELDCD